MFTICIVLKRWLPTTVSLNTLETEIPRWLKQPACVLKILQGRLTASSSVTVEKLKCPRAGARNTLDYFKSP